MKHSYFSFSKTVRLKDESWFDLEMQCLLDILNSIILDLCSFNAPVSASTTRWESKMIHFCKILCLRQSHFSHPHSLFHG